MKTNELRTPLTASAALYALVFLFATPVYSQTPFYQGKTISIVQGRDPGGTGDMRVRAMMPFLQKYIPGNPNIVSEYMPGGGGRKAANHVYRSARPDGLMIGNPGLGMVAAAVLGESGVLYDLDKFFYLGSPYSSYHPLFLSRRQAGLSSIEKLTAASGVRIGGQSVGFSTYNEGRLFAYILGLKDPKFIAGYAGPEIDQALMRGRLMLGRRRLIRWRNGTRTGSKAGWWTFTRSWKFPRATNIPSSSSFPSWRALPGPIESVR